MLSENTSVRMGLIIVLVGALYWLISSILLNNALGEANAKDQARLEVVVDNLTKSYYQIAADISAIKAIQSAQNNRQDRMAEYLRGKLK